MASFKSPADVVHMEGLGLESNVKTSSFDPIFYYQRGLQGVKADTPILVLIHGYPQSNFMWRHVVSLLPTTIPLFIPDIPGYGRSAPLSGSHSKRHVGTALLNALSTLLPHPGKQSIIIAGHDRGARVSHRLAVDNNHPSIDIRGAILLDIVPLVTQWLAMSNPIAAEKMFHWPLLANVEIATPMIKAYGGDEWVKGCLKRWAGNSEAGSKSFEANNAIEVYADFFNQESVIRASNDDYRAGAEEDIDEQKEDQASGRKLQIPTLLLYSQEYLGMRYDMLKVWGEWIGDEKLLEAEAIGEGSGHFFAEEAPQKAADAISKYYAKLA